MIKILRTKNIVINNSSNIDVFFTENITSNLVPANVSILSQTTNTPDSKVLSLAISGNVLSITCQPLTPYSAYFLQFQSTVNNPFISTNGDAKISQDGISNKTLITGPIQSDNPIYDYLQSFYTGNIYEQIGTPGSVVDSYIQAISINFARALYDIRQLKNENYLSFNVIDEQKIRGTGPFDRLNEEGAYDVLRVGFGPTNSPVSTSFIFTDFPTYPVTLQRQLITEIIKPSSNNENGTFNINTLIFNLSNNPITRVDSIVFTLITSNPVYIYNIPDLGYQILDSEYDRDFASSYLLLENNQIKINESILQDPNFSLDQIFSISVNYEYKGLGIVVDPITVNVYTTLSSNREVLPPITNIFNLQHAPITDASNNTLITGAVTFTDPNSNTGSPHPAFITEIGFSLSALPSSPGIYSIDYSVGKVYVYGASSANDGTGPSPPLATYYYKFTYTPEIDYVYDQDLLNIVALPLGNLVNSTGNITFNYEQVLVPGVDYNADTHIESINELVGNNLIAVNALTTVNSPITNVFQIYNQTSGEIYLLDRWTNNNVVYFKYNNPPRILKEVRESSTFLTVTNELLGINTTSINASSIRIFTIYLGNNTIIASTQDCIGSSINTSITFTNGNIFVSEVWYNSELDVATNINRLVTPGFYTVDYENGIVYLAVSNTQNNDIGTISYKMDSIVPDFPHVVSVDNIYYQISSLSPKNKQFSYISFADGSIIPANLDISDEKFLNGVSDAPYQILNGNIGAFVGETFVAGVTNSVKFIRGVYEYNDLFNNTNPINFSNVSSSNNFNINVGSINGQSFESIQFDGTHYYVTLNQNISYLSPYITYTFNVVRASDSQILWNSSGTVVPGNPLKLILPGTGSPHAGDLVNVTYSFSINDLSRVVVDYNKGDFYVDYTYVADEILVSYEYGDNVIDFRQNTNIPAGYYYYVSYKVGALRDALLANFGTLVNVPDLSNFDLSLNRERYREALQAALSSFIQGPTVAAIKNIVQIISHVEPQVIESAFQIWSLGSNLLNPVGIQTTGAFQLLPAKFGNGALINQIGQSITMPVSSNLRLEEGTFETWIIPQWAGLDNDADLTFNITKNGVAIGAYEIFIGSSEYHPLISNGNFTINKNSNATGYPNINKDGIFIYYDNDPSNQFQRWYVKVVDGYVAADNNTYKFGITSSGKFYDAKSISTIKPSNLSSFTGTNKINFAITPSVDGYGINEGLTFISDLEHYLLDFGLDKTCNRLSIYKDVSGYMNFRVYDNKKALYSISANISNWQPNAAHMVAASWKLNTRNNRDEMHLFIDGLEVPNIIRYGQSLKAYDGENFRTINPEEIVGSINRDIVGSIDLVTTINTPIVSSSINFSDYNIFAGDIIYILEVGFPLTGYTIDSIDGQTLTLAQNLPASITNGRYSINQTSYNITSEINVVPNIAVSTVSMLLTSNDLVAIDGYSYVSSPSVNFSAAGVLPGFMIRIDNNNFDLTYNILSVEGHELLIAGTSPISLSGLTFQIYSNVETEIPGVRALNPSYSISQTSSFVNVLTISNDVFANDLILIKTLGLNSRNVDQSYYVWGDGYENILKTQLPAPINLDEISITKTIVSSTAITSKNSTLAGNSFDFNIYDDGYSFYQPSNIKDGRTLQVTISGTNINFTSPVVVSINGNTESGSTVEAISFNDYGALSSAHKYININHIEVTGTVYNNTIGFALIKINETYPITYSENEGIVPVIKYSYPIGWGSNLSANGHDVFVTDEDNLFSNLDVGNYLIIKSPPSAVGYYSITGLSSDRHSISLMSENNSNTIPLSAFSNGKYTVLNATQYRSGLQNGFLNLEIDGYPGQPWFLNKGFYELDYSTYLSVKFSPINTDLYIGTDHYGNGVINSIMDQFTLSSIILTDTRIGEVVSKNIGSITKDFNSIKAPASNPNTLVLIDFDSFPFTNDAGFYSNSNNDHIHFQSDFAVNDNFEQSVVILDKPILLLNNGILDTRKQATIEFWMSPLFDTANDPNYRFYFDAYGAIVEQATSVNNVSVKLSQPASKILNVTLSSGDPRIDYFAGGKLEIDTQNAIQEEQVPQNTNVITVGLPILQVISVKIVGDFTGTDYFNNGTIGLDNRTIYLGTPLPNTNIEIVIIYQTTNNKNLNINTQVIRLNKQLPAQNSVVTVKYIPQGLQGDRISLFKDPRGFINFAISASGTDYIISAESHLAENTWHRIKASYQVNSGIGNDEMRLFIDGYEYTDVSIGQDGYIGQFPAVVGSSAVGDGYMLISSIVFKDPINNLFIGTDYNNANPIYTLLDNFRISNIARPIYAPYGEPIDVNYSTNLSTVFPVTSDLYTTYLMDFNTEITLNTNFATLIDRDSGSFEFTVNIFDMFNIVNGSPQVKQILENLINILKPANSRVYIKYLT